MLTQLLLYSRFSSRIYRFYIRTRAVAIAIGISIFAMYQGIMRIILGDGARVGIIDGTAYGWLLLICGGLLLFSSLSERLLKSILHNIAATLLGTLYIMLGIDVALQGMAVSSSAIILGICLIFYEALWRGWQCDE